MIATLVGAVPAILSALLFLVMWIFVFSAIAADKNLLKVSVSTAFPPSEHQTTRRPDMSGCRGGSYKKPIHKKPILTRHLSSWGYSSQPGSATETSPYSYSRHI